MRRWLAGILVVAIAVVLVGCSLLRGSGERPAESVEGAAMDEWVIVSFEAHGKSDAALMDSLLETELAADGALQDRGLGWIDGNEVGQGSYDLYFVGRDGEAMWAILRPILDKAPARWARAELRHGLADAHPKVVKRT